MPTHSDGDAAARVRPRPPERATDTNAFIEQLPRTIAGLPSYVLTVGSAALPWHVTITLTPPDQAALDALGPSAYQLCAAAQHALGLAALGSQIDAAQALVVLRADPMPRLGFVGAGALWWVANAPPALLRALLEQLAAQLARHDG